MGHEHIASLSARTVSPAEERVGKEETTEMTTGNHDETNQVSDVTQESTHDTWTVVKGRTRTRSGEASSTTGRSKTEKKG